MKHAVGCTVFEDQETNKGSLSSQALQRYTITMKWQAPHSQSKPHATLCDALITHYRSLTNSPHTGSHPIAARDEVITCKSWRPLQVSSRLTTGYRTFTSPDTIVTATSQFHTDSSLSQLYWNRPTDNTKPVYRARPKDERRRCLSFFGAARLP